MYLHPQQLPPRPAQPGHRAADSLEPSLSDSSMKSSSVSEEFSFSKALPSEGKITIRADLFKLPKEDIIEILMEEIQECKQMRVKIAHLEAQCPGGPPSGPSPSPSPSRHPPLQHSPLQHPPTHPHPSPFSKSNSGWGMAEGKSIPHRDTASRDTGSRRGEDVGRKYRELEEYMEEYIQSTNQAQKCLSKRIAQLEDSLHSTRAQKRTLSSNVQELEAIISQKQSEIEELQARLEVKPWGGEAELSGISMEKEDQQERIHNLETSLNHYVSINNECTRKYHKLERLYSDLEEKVSQKEAEASSINSFNTVTPTKTVSTNTQTPLTLTLTQQTPLAPPVGQQSGPGVKEMHGVYGWTHSEEEGRGHKNNESISEQDELKLLHIQNKELMEINSHLERALQKKSHKIRNLLEELQKLSEKKWQYKQKYMELKTKSYAQVSHHSNSYQTSSGTYPDNGGTFGESSEHYHTGPLPHVPTSASSIHIGSTGPLGCAETGLTGHLPGMAPAERAMGYLGGVPALCAGGASALRELSTNKSHPNYQYVSEGKVCVV